MYPFLELVRILEVDTLLEYELILPLPDLWV